MLHIAAPADLVILDFWADLGCPWCYIGSRRLALAVAHEPDGSVLTRWRSFQLRPGLPDAGPAETGPLGDLTLLERSLENRVRICAAGREVGIVFDEGSLESVPDTALAQRAVLLYDGQPRQRAVSAALYAAHFERRRDISRLDVVAEVTGHAAGEAAQRVLDRLASGEGETELAADLLEARLVGVTAVPTYVVGGRVAIQGAQEVDVLRALIAEGRTAG